MTERKQFVSYNGTSSSMKTVCCGVSQGSILGPILFLLYINDLSNVCKNTEPFLFADDSNLFISDSDPYKLQSQLNNELENISQIILEYQEDTLYGVYWEKKNNYRYIKVKDFLLQQNNHHT